MSEKYQQYLKTQQMADAMKAAAEGEILMVIKGTVESLNKEIDILKSINSQFNVSFMPEWKALITKVEGKIATAKANFKASKNAPSFDVDKIKGFLGKDTKSFGDIGKGIGGVHHLAVRGFILKNKADFSVTSKGVSVK